jgi:DNA polymerase-3 subunit epsilon
MSDVLHAVANSVGLTLMDLGLDVYRVAAWIEAQGNTGYRRAQIDAAAKDSETLMLTDWMVNACADAWTGIVFLHQDRRWMVRKNPHWSTVWIKLYGDWHPEIVAQIQREEAEKEAKAAAERAAKEEADRMREEERRKRPREYGVMGEYTLIPTLQLAHMLVIAEVLGMGRAYSADLYDERMEADNSYDSPLLYVRSVWNEQLNHLLDELRFRAVQKGDALAKDALEGRLAIYTRDTFAAWRATVDPVRFAVNVREDMLPINLSPNQPVAAMDNAAVQRLFLEALDPETGHEILDREDRDVMLGILRQQLKRLRKERVVINAEKERARIAAGQVRNPDEGRAWARGLVEAGDWVVIDTETTGLDKVRDVPIQVAVVAGDGTVLLDTLIAPREGAPHGAEHIHGISQAMLADAPAFGDVRGKLLDALKDKRVLAWNAVFDENMIRNANGRRKERPASFRGWMCAMEAYAMYRRGYSFGRRVALAQACAEMGVEVAAAAHSAVGDCLRVVEIVKRMAAAPDDGDAARA